MQYTEQKENALFASWKFDVEEDDFSKILDILNREFRTFGDGLTDVMERKSGLKILDPIKYLKETCIAEGIDPSEIASANTLKSWFSDGPRPKKSESSRCAMFAFAFALSLTPSETADLFHKVFLDRAFNQRNYKELIYYYCINNGLSFSHAEQLISSVNLQESIKTDRTMHTVFLGNEANRSTDSAELIDFIHNHGHNFSLNNESAKRILCHQKEKALEYARKEAELTWDKAIYSGRDKTSDSFLYSVITERTVAGKKGTITVPFKDATFPREIKNNFPQVKSLSDKVVSYDEIRKSIILLFSYSFWREAQNQNVTDFFDDYADQLNDLLIRANMSPLYYGNPYDWMFLYCTYTDYPLDTFRGILSEALDEVE